MTPIVIYRFIHYVIYVIWNFKIPTYIYLHIWFENKDLPEKDNYLMYQKDIYYPVNNLFSLPLCSAEQVIPGRAQLGSYDKDEICFFV